VNNSSWQRIVPLLLIGGCATPSTILDQPVYGTFRSTKDSLALAACIDQNANDFALNSLQSAISNTKSEPITVLIRNGSFIGAVVQVTSASKGSTADFRFGGGLAIAPDSAFNRLTKNCG
jgi:hypothetical protein